MRSIGEPKAASKGCGAPRGVPGRLSGASAADDVVRKHQSKVHVTSRKASKGSSALNSMLGGLPGASAVQPG